MHMMGHDPTFTVHTVVIQIALLCAVGLDAKGLASAACHTIDLLYIHVTMMVSERHMMLFATEFELPPTRAHTQHRQVQIERSRSFCIKGS
eukprot:c45564_g1_i1 orf=184-456(+)